jgi:hypothetical protein
MLARPRRGTPLPRPWYVLYAQGKAMTESSLRFLRLLRAGGSTREGDARGPTSSHISGSFTSSLGLDGGQVTRGGACWGAVLVAKGSG